MPKITKRKPKPYEPSEQRKRSKDPMAKKPRRAVTPMPKTGRTQKSKKKGPSYNI